MIDVDIHLSSTPVHHLSQGIPLMLSNLMARNKKCGNHPPTLNSRCMLTNWKQQDGSRGEEEKKRCEKEEEIGGKGGQIRKYKGERRVKRKKKKKNKKGGDGVGQEGNYKESHCPETMNRNKEERRTGKKGGTKRETVPRLLREVEGTCKFLNYTKIAFTFAILFHMLLWLLGSSNFTDQSISLKSETMNII
ncbi:hypothetical protein DVH24_005338 [Malus domestica]|uniref:Uncharacterized protein n=1 Tax=Malus domestica TaxID=3750 RepID=A0A498KPF2_MALDO|nr:hypothetical protein DVH24_005338 [Malus domestica]